MANPQKENGHVDIANEIVENLAKIHLSSRESQILWAIFRKTYGWHKKEDWITGNQLIEMTGISKSHISETIKGLIRRQLVIKNGKKLGFQKDYDKWGKFPLSGTIKKFPLSDKKFPIGGTGVPDRGNKKFPIGGNTKETIITLTNKNIQKTISKEFFDKNSAVYQLTMYLEGKIRENNEAVKKKTESQLQNWCKDMSLLINKDKANPTDVKQIIDWVVEDDFWSANILSAKKLRKHYPRFYKKVIDKGKSLESYNWENDPTMEFLKHEKEGE